jgi:ribosome-binding factor A
MKHFIQDKMPTQRQLRVGENIKQVLSEVLLAGKKLDPILMEISITVSEVRMSPDLKVANCYVLPFGKEISPENLIEALHNSRGQIRNMVNKKVSLKFSPEIRFYYDVAFDRAEEINQLIEANIDERKRRGEED